MEVLARQYLEVDDLERIFPGELIGEPIAKIIGSIKHEFSFPWTFDIIVTEKVVKEFKKAQLTGVNFLNIQIQNEDEIENQTLFLLKPTLSRRRFKTDIEYCHICCRPLNIEKQRPVPYLYNKEGFDIFSPDDNLDFVFVSKRCRQVILDNNFKNILLVPIKR
jgi:hypothetical protein